MKLSLKRLIQSHKAWPNPGTYVWAFYNGFAVFSILDYIILMLFSLSLCKRVGVINKMMIAVRFTCQIKFITVSMEWYNSVLSLLGWAMTKIWPAWLDCINHLGFASVIDSVQPLGPYFSHSPPGRDQKLIISYLYCFYRVRVARSVSFPSTCYPHGPVRAHSRCLLLWLAVPVNPSIFYLIDK